VKRRIGRQPVEVVGVEESPADVGRERSAQCRRAGARCPEYVNATTNDGRQSQPLSDCSVGRFRSCSTTPPTDTALG
jgi:hypothetical protein